MGSVLRISTVVILLFLTGNGIEGDPDKSVVYKTCKGNSGSFTYMDIVQDVLDDLTDQRPKFGYDYTDERHQVFTDTCYGHGKCNRVLSHQECHQCLLTASNMLRDTCDWSIGTQVQLVNCRIQYENYVFYDN